MKFCKFLQISWKNLPTITTNGVLTSSSFCISCWTQLKKIIKYSEKRSGSTFSKDKCLAQNYHFFFVTVKPLVFEIIILISCYINTNKENKIHSYLYKTHIIGNELFYTGHEYVLLQMALETNWQFSALESFLTVVLKFTNNFTKTKYKKVYFQCKKVKFTKSSANIFFFTKSCEIKRENSLNLH
jgi:hypothetical protein